MYTILLKNRFYLNHLYDSITYFEQVTSIWKIQKNFRKFDELSKSINSGKYLILLSRFYDAFSTEKSHSYGKHEDLILHLLEVIKLVPTKSVKNFTENCLMKFEERIGKNECIPTAKIFEIYLIIKENPSLINVDLEELKNIIKTFFLNETITSINDFSNLIEHFGDCNIELNSDEFEYLKNRFSTIISEGVQISESVNDDELDDFDISMFNPELYRHERIGSGIFELEELSSQLEKVSEFFDEDARDIISDIDTRARDYYRNSKNKSKDDAIKLNVNNNSKKIEIDALFETLLEKG
jgi:hypothetical protein